MGRGRRELTIPIGDGCIKYRWGGGGGTVEAQSASIEAAK